MMSMFPTGKFSIVIDGQWGSTGKGKLLAFIFEQNPQVSVVVGDNMPNAGHSFYGPVSGEKHVSKALPVGAWFPTVHTVIIGPHAVFDVDRLLMEVAAAQKERGDFTLAIHPRACVLSQADADVEKQRLTGISSTMQGSAEAVIRKMRRDPKDSNIAKHDLRVAKFVADTGTLVRESLLAGAAVISETAQGFDLGINFGHQYPYTTSRDCLVGRAFDNAGIPPHPDYYGDIVGIIRTYPIRVGSLEGSTSGPYYSDHEETTWAHLSEKIGQQIEEYTTVTGRVRRVFDFSFLQLERFLQHVRPNYMFLNFVNYLTDPEPFYEKLQQCLNAHGCKLWMLGTGPKNDEVELRQLPD